MYHNIQFIQDFVPTNNNQVFGLSMQIQKLQPIEISEFTWGSWMGVPNSSSQPNFD